MRAKSIKVLTVNISDDSGGAARAAYRIHRAIIESGIDGQFLVKNKSLNDETVLALNSFDSYAIIKVPFRFVQHKIKNKLQQARWKPYRNKEDVFLSDLRGSSLHGALQKIDYDILHLHWINLRFVDINELAKINKPIVWTLHDCWPFTGICHYFYKCERYKKSCGCCPYLASNDENDLSHKVWQEKMKIFSKLNIHVVCPSNWLAKATRESSIFNQFRVSVIPNPIDTEYFCPVNNADSLLELGLIPQKKYILFGAMNALKDSRKGFVEFKKAIQYFEQNYNIKNTEILIFGSDEAPEMGIKNMVINNLGILRDKKLLAAYRTADVMIVPSLSENLSNIIMESLSCGTPVVAFDIGGNSDMIDHLQNGYLAKELDSFDIANGINYCLTKNLKNQFSNHIRKKVIENFNTKIVGSQYFELYNEIF